MTLHYYIYFTIIICVGDNIKISWFTGTEVKISLCKNNIKIIKKVKIWLDLNF